MDNGPRRIPAVIATAVALFALAVMLVQARLDHRRVERARTAMIATLERLSRAQHDHRATTGSYAATLEELGIAAPGYGMQLTMNRWGSAGWWATVRNRGIGIAPDRCGIFLGDSSASPHRSVVRAGVAACW